MTEADVPLQIGLVGGAGRLGQAIGDWATASGATAVTFGRGGWDALYCPDVVIDASSSEALPRTIAYCSQNQLPLVYAVSTISVASRRRLIELSADSAVLMATNLAHGHWLQRTAVDAVLSEIDFRSGIRVTVSERHPSTKTDSPSGTARSLMSLLGAGAPAESINETIEVSRKGEPVSDHSVTFEMAGEVVEIKHSVTTLHASAVGAMDAARFIKTADPGLWTMSDVHRRRAGV